MSKKATDDPDIVLNATGWDYYQVQSPDMGPLKYAVTGRESQVVSLQLAPGERVVAEPGVMMYLSPGMNQSVSCDVGSCCGRCCSGEECCWVNFSGSDGGYVALTPNFPTAKVLPVDLSSPHVNGRLICQKGAFMASYGNVNVGVNFDCNFMRCCCGGLGLIRQKLDGDGTAFLAATGTIVQKVLDAGETILVDGNCIMAFGGQCKVDLRRAGGIMGMMGGGEGIFNTTVTGPGLVIVQSMNQVVFMTALVANKLIRR